MGIINILKMPVTCRNGYLMIGVCLGLTLSLLFSRVEIDESNQKTIESSWYPFTITAPPNSIDEYVPKINLEGKPRSPQKSPKSFIRPRYYYTELGIREKLFVGILTSSEYLHSRGVAFNRTLAHLVEKIRYFITIPEGTKKPNVTLSGIVGFTDTRSLLQPFHVIKYITDNYLEDYDYYYIVKDTAYVNARRLMELVQQISVSKDIYLGKPAENSDYCSLEAGILISNSIVRQLKNNLDWCVKNSYSTDDANFGRCLAYSTKMPCSCAIADIKYHSEILPHNFDFNNDLKKLLYDKPNLRNYISIYPITNSVAIYQMNAYFAAAELTSIEQKIHDIREEILLSVHLSPQINNTNWPTGNQPGNKAPGRFDILRWNYFNSTHIFMSTDFEIARELIGSIRLEINRVLDASINKIQKNYNNELEFDKLINGYRKFDASRGMDYIVDLNFVDKTKGGSITKRIQVCKPLGKVEILLVPYVTENTRINMIFTVNYWIIEDTLEFIEQYASVCMDKKDKTSLMLVLLYDPQSPSKGNNDVYHRIKTRAMNLTDKYRKDQLKITWLSIRLPMPSINIAEHTIVKIAVADLATKKYSPESLLLFVNPKMQLKPEYLNRVRMNTISNWQIYSPIPFVEFHPNLAYYDSKNTGFDLNRNHGRYDDLNYDSISFYTKDYQAVRKISDKEIPLIRTDKDLSLRMSTMSRIDINSIFELFIIYTELHAFRAVEPALKIHYQEINCDGMMSDNAKDNCEVRKSLHLGNRGQLAKLVKQYQNS